MTQDDPYTQTYKHLLGIFTRRFEAMEDPVMVGNIIDLDVKHPAFKELFTDADFPGVILTQGGFGGSPWDEGGNNADTLTRQVYRLELAEKSMNVRRVNALKWEALQALAAAGATLNVGTPQPLTFIDQWRIVEGRDHVRAPGDRGLLTFIAVQVDFRHPTLDLSAGA